MRKAAYPGSFDPITRGHIDIIERASLLYDEVDVLIMRNLDKKCMFTFEKRKEMIEKSVSHLANVKVILGKGLTIQMCEEIEANVMIRGIRATSDYEYEMQIATANMMLNKQIETVFLLSKPEYSFVSSSTVKEIAKYQGELSQFVNDSVKKELVEYFKMEGIDEDKSNLV